MFTKWLISILRDQGGPIVFLSLLYTALGLAFLTVSRPVGGVLLGTGLGIAAIFLLLAYLMYRKETSGRPSRTVRAMMGGS